jgi:hypothetical protein
MPNRIIFTSKTKKAADSGKIPSSVDMLLQTDDSPNMDDFRNWASDTTAIISLNKTLQNEGIGNTDAGAQYYNRYGSASLYQTKLIPNTDYAGRSVAAQGDNRSWMRKDYIDNYKITCRGVLNKSSTIFSVNLSGVQQTEKLYTIVVPTAGGTGGQPGQEPQSNVLGNPPQLPGIFDGTYFRKLTTTTGNTLGSTSITVSSIYGNSVASFGISAGCLISGTGIPDGTLVGSSYSIGSVTIPLVNDQGNPVALTADVQGEIIIIDVVGEPAGLIHYNTPANGTGARFAIYVNEDSNIEEVIVSDPGTGYSASNQTTVNKLIIPGSFVGGDDGDNDVTITSYNLNTYAILITTTDFNEKNLNILDYVSSEETGIDTFTYSGTAAGTLTKSATMVKDQTFITVTNASLIQKGMTVVSSTGFGIPQNTIVADSYVVGSTTVPLSTVNGITPQKVTLTYGIAISVSFSYAATFTNITGTNISGSGSGATFIVTKNTNNTYNVFMTNPGTSYITGTQILILGSKLGGVDGTNNLTITVTKILDKFPAGTRVTFFEKSTTNPGYYEIYFSSLPRTGVTLSKVSTATGNTNGNSFITVTNTSSIASGQQITSTSTGIPTGTYVANSYVSGSAIVPLSEADGTTVVQLTADLNNAALTFSAPTVIESGETLILARSTNSFWAQLNSGSIFEGRPAAFVGWYRATRFSVRNIAATLQQPTPENAKYNLYSQRFKIDTTVNLRTAITLNSDWSLYLQVGRNLDPKWETLVITSVEIEDSYTGVDGKIHYVFQIVTQYPSKYSWNLASESISYCYIYRNVLGGIDSSYISQSIPFNKVYLSSEYVWLAPKVVTIPVTNIAGQTAGGVFRMNSINDTPSETFRYVDRDTYSMYFRTWRDLVVDSTPDPLTSNQVRLTSTAADQRYMYANPRTVQFRSSINGNVYINVDTGTLFLGSSPSTNGNINYANNIVRLDTGINFAPSSPGTWTYTFGRQYLYYQEYAWNYYIDNLVVDTRFSNSTTLAVPYKFVSTVPYGQGCTVTGRGSGTAILISIDGHGLQAGDPILFSAGVTGMSSGSISSRGIRSGTTYYVSSLNLTANTFEITTTRGGATSLTSSSTSTVNAAVYAAMQTNSSVTASQVDGIQVTGLHGLVNRSSYKIQAGTTEPIQLQDIYYYTKREFPNKENTDGPAFTISSISRTNNTVTVVTTSSHFYANGERVTVTSSDVSLNTTDASPAIITVVNGTTFRYTLSGTNVSAGATGTVQARTGWGRFIKLDSEIISYDYYTVDGNNKFTLYGVLRGQLGTTSAPHNANTDISVVFDLWASQNARISNPLFNTDGTLKPNVALTYQNNWSYTREFPDYGGDTGTLYHGIGRRDTAQPSRWEVAMYGPGYFSPGYLTYVTSVDQNDALRTPGTYSNVGSTATTNGTGFGARFTIIIASDANRTVTATVTSAGQDYAIGNTITIPAAAIGNTGSALTLTVSYLNLGTLYAGKNLGEPGIGSKITKNPYYQALYKENSQIKYYLEPSEVNQRSYEDLFGAYAQSMVTTKNLISGIPDDTTPYYNSRSNADTILLQASRDQYFSYLSALSKRPKYLTTATTLNSNTLVINDIEGVEVGDTIYGPGIAPDGAIIKSIINPSYFTLSSRNGVIKIGGGTYKKTSGFWGWNADAYSVNSFTTNVYAAARAGETTTYMMFGLNTDPAANASYDSLDYAWYCAYGNLYIYESGRYIGSYGAYYTTTQLLVEYDGTSVNYYKDGTLQRSISRSIGLPLYFDSSFYSINGSFTNVEFGEIGPNSSSSEATIKLRSKRVLIKDIDIYIPNSNPNVIKNAYDLVSDASLGSCARIAISNSYNISQQLGAPIKYYISEIKFEYVDPVYASGFRTFLFEADNYSAPILKTEIDNSTGYLYLYVTNPNLVSPKTQEKYNSSLYSLRAKLNIVTFEDAVLNPSVTRVAVPLSTTSKTLTVGSVTGIQQGMTVTTYNAGGITTYPGEVAANTVVSSIVDDTHITINNFPTIEGLSSLKFESTVTYPVGTKYTIEPLPNLNKGTRYIVDTAKPLHFTSKWAPSQTVLDLYYTADVNDPSPSINYQINFDDPVRYYAVDSGDRFIYKIPTVSLNAGSSYLSRSTADTTFANLVVGQKIYFTNIPVGISLTENTPYYITYVLNNDIRISNSLGGAPIDISSGVTLSNLNLRMRRVYDTGLNKNILRTSLSYYDYQVQQNITDVPNGNAFTKVVAANGGTLNNGQVVSQTVSGTAKTSYSSITSSPVTGTATTNATFNVIKSGSSYSATLANGGSGYSGVTQVKILGTDLGGSTPSNDLTINVTVTTGAVTAVGAVSGTALTIYSGLSVANISGSGSGAIFNVTVSGTTYSVSRVDSGSGYVAGNQVRILGTSLGGATTANDLTITITSASTGASNLLVTSGTVIESGMYVVSDTVGIPNGTVVGSSYVSGSTTIPLRTTSGSVVTVTANMSGSTIIFTKAALKIYEYNNTSSTTYPYIGISIRPSAIGYPIEASGVNVQIPSTSFQDQIQFTFANNTLPQELYPYAKIEILYPSTVLAQSISSNDTVIKVNGTIPDGYPEFGNIKIGTERIYYGYKTDTYFGDCVIKFTHTVGDAITYSPNYAIKPDGNLHNGCPQNNNTKLIVMSATPSTGVGYSASASPQTIYVAGLEADKDNTNSISFPSTAKYNISNDKVNYSEVTVNRTGNSITIPGGTIKAGQTLNDGDEIILNSSFGLGSGYKIVKFTSTGSIQINKPATSDTSNEYRRLFTLDSEIIAGLNDTFVDSAIKFNSGRGLKFVGLSGCTDFKPIKCSKIKYATAASNKYANTITLADDIAATTYTLTGLNSYFSSGSTIASGVKSVLSFDGEDYEIKSINGRVVTLVEPLKQKVRFRDSVTIKSEIYKTEFERVAGVKGLIYGPQKAIFYDRFRAAQVSVQYLGYVSQTNRYRWRLTFTYGTPVGIAINDKISSILNYNDYYVSAVPSSSEFGTTTTSSQIIVSASTTTSPVASNSSIPNQNIIYISKPNGYVAREFESASMQIGGFKNASRQQIVGSQVLSEATDGAIADIEAVATRATRDIFTASVAESLGRFLFRQKNFSSSNRPNLWRNEITVPTGMNVKTGNMVSYLINGVPNYVTYQVGGSKIFYGNSTTWNNSTQTGVTFNGIGMDETNSRILFACNSGKIRYASFAAPQTQTEVTVAGSGTMLYVTYVNGYYFAANSTGGLYYSSSVAGPWFTITTGNTSPVVSVYYDEFKFIVSHQKIEGSGIVYKNYIFAAVTNANMAITTSTDKIQGITNLFSGEYTVASTYGFGKIIESTFDKFDGTNYVDPYSEVYEYENYSDSTADDISEDYQTTGLSFNYGQFFAFGKRVSTGLQFIKYSSNARKWALVDTAGLISATDEITSVIYGGFNTYIIIAWNPTTSTNKILLSNVKGITTSDLTVSDLSESGRYRKIEEADTVKLYKYKTTVSSQEGNLLLWNSTSSQLIWLKSLFGSPLKSNEFTDYKALAAENFVVYTKNSRLLPNFRSLNDTNGASRPVTIYNEQLPLGTPETVASSGSGYQFGTYVNVQVLNGNTADYGSDTNRALATVIVDDTGKVISAYIDSAGDYYPSNVSLPLVNGTGQLSGSPTTSLNSTRSISKTLITYTVGDIVSYTKTANAWAAGASSITVNTSANIVVGMEVFGGSMSALTPYYVSAAYNPGSTSVPLVTATGAAASLPVQSTSATVTFKLNYITIPAGSNVSGLVRGMTIVGSGSATGRIQTGTVILSNYSASETVGPVVIPISKIPSDSFVNGTLTFSITGSQASITTTQTNLDKTSFTLNGITNASTGYCVLYRNILTGIQFIALFFNNQGVLIDCITDLTASDVLHLSRTEMFGQGL